MGAPGNIRAAHNGGPIQAESRFPFAFALGMTAIGLLTRFEILSPPAPHPAPVLWLFALGWAVARARTLPQRSAVSAIAGLSVLADSLQQGVRHGGGGTGARQRR